MASPSTQRSAVPHGARGFAGKCSLPGVTEPRRIGKRHALIRECATRGKLGRGVDAVQAGALAPQVPSVDARCYIRLDPSPSPLRGSRSRIVRAAFRGNRSHHTEPPPRSHHRLNQNIRKPREIPIESKSANRRRPDTETHRALACGMKRSRREESCRSGTSHEELV